MLKLGERIVIHGTTLFADDQDPTTFYVLPDTICLRPEDDGEPSFLFVRFASAEGAHGEEPRGLVRLRLLARVDAHKRGVVRDVLRARLSRLRDAGKLPANAEIEPRLCLPPFGGGRARMFLGKRSGKVLASDPMLDPAALAATLDVQLGADIAEIQEALSQPGGASVSFALSFPARFGPSATVLVDAVGLREELWASARAFRLDPGANKYVRFNRDLGPLTPGELRRASAAEDATIVAFVHDEVLDEMVSRHVWVPDGTIGTTTTIVDEDGTAREAPDEEIAIDQVAAIGHERLVQAVRERFFDPAVAGVSGGPALPAGERRLREEDRAPDTLDVELWDAVVWWRHEVTADLASIIPAEARARGLYSAASAGSYFSARTADSERAPGYLIHVRALVVVRGEWSKAWLYLRVPNDPSSAATFSFSKKRRGASFWVRATHDAPASGYEYKLVWRSESGDVLEGGWKPSTAPFLLLHETPRARWTEVLLRRATVFGDELEAIRVDLECRAPGREDQFRTAMFSAARDDEPPPSGYEPAAQGTATVVPRSAWGEGVQRASFVITGRPEDRSPRAWRIRAAPTAVFLYRFTFIYKDGWSAAFPLGGDFAPVGPDRVLRVGEPYTFSVLVLLGLRLPEDAERLDVRLSYTDPILRVHKRAHFVFDEETWGEKRWNVGSMSRGPLRYDAEIVYHLANGESVHKRLLQIEDEALVVRTPDAMG